MRISRKQAREMGIDVSATGKGRAGYGGSKKTKAIPGTFQALCKAHGLPEPVPEYPFAPPRKWRFDWLFEGWLALEVEGLAEGGGEGRHQRTGGWLKDMEKYNEAAIRGYVVLRCTTKELNSGAACALIKRALGSSEEQP